MTNIHSFDGLQNEVLLKALLERKSSLESSLTSLLNELNVIESSLSHFDTALIREKVKEYVPTRRKSEISVAYSRNWSLVKKIKWFVFYADKPLTVSDIVKRLKGKEPKLFSDGATSYKYYKLSISGLLYQEVERGNEIGRNKNAKRVYEYYKKEKAPD